MRATRPFQLALLTALTAAATVVAVTPAAANPAGTASAGSATVISNGHPIPVAPVGPCSLTGQQQGSSNGATKDGIVSYGSATSSCGRDSKAHTSSSLAKGTNFALSALQNYGGPLIRMAAYQVNCAATLNGTNASWSFSGLTGVTVPTRIPQNYTVQIKSAGKLLANVILNEVTLPNPNDGSITLNLMHIVLFPNGTPDHTVPMSGDVYVGSTACSPTV